MAYFWKVPNSSNSSSPFCLNLTQNEEELFIISYALARLYGKQTEEWMLNIEQHFFSRSNALSMYDLCKINAWLDSENLSYMQLNPYITRNPSSGPKDRVLFSKRRDSFLKNIEFLSESDLINLGSKIISNLNEKEDAIEPDKIQEEGVKAYYHTLNIILSDNYEQDEDIETNMPELVSQNDFLVLNQKDIYNERLKNTILFLTEIQEEYRSPCILDTLDILNKLNTD